MKLKKITWITIVVLAITIGLYPLSFIVFNSTADFLKFKGDMFEANNIWYLAFYTHILLAGIALLTGWPQFSKKLRKKHLKLHRMMGRVYVVVVLISAIAGFYLAIHANGGTIAKFGFGGMSISWLITTILAYTTIMKRDIKNHQKWMIRSFAVTLTGVSFRLWLPLLLFGFDLNFLLVYKIDSWISWVLNLAIAEILIRAFLDQSASETSSI